MQDGCAVGAVRLSIDHERHWGRVSALCVLPQYQGQGIAQCALREIERRHTDIERWYLDTILEEAGNCHLYEKLGYCRTGTPQPINAYMTLVNYEKNKQS
ncbi:MAG: GNAT family N-acetyltransferase [Clostridia bacterium]|nr:GNAT family N-acetyltransferase [Clostridia bacterium]